MRSPKFSILATKSDVQSQTKHICVPGEVAPRCAPPPPPCGGAPWPFLLCPRLFQSWNTFGVAWMSPVGRLLRNILTDRYVQGAGPPCSLLFTRFSLLQVLQESSLFEQPASVLLTPAAEDVCGMFMG